VLVAPAHMRDGIVAEIERTIAAREAGEHARIAMKMNSLVDKRCIRALYRASQAGVPVDLWVRGICALRPGVAGLSETIRVRSVLGRFLEHSRVYEFANGGDPEVWIGSADLMHRNLDRRVEALVAVPSARHRAAVGELLDLGFAERSAAWELGPDGRWTRSPADRETAVDVQEHLIEAARRRAPQRG
jgi:polyphosphate kinase